MWDIVSELLGKMLSGFGQFLTEAAQHLAKQLTHDVPHRLLPETLPPSLEQIVFLFDEFVGELRHDGLHFLGIALRRPQDERSRSAQIERNQRAQQLLHRQGSSPVSDGKIVNHPRPNIVWESEALPFEKPDR